MMLHNEARLVSRSLDRSGVRYRQTVEPRTMQGRMDCAIKNMPYLSISPPLVRHIDESWVPAAEGGSGDQREIKRRNNNAIHDVGQARRELRASAQGVDGRHCEPR